MKRIPVFFACLLAAASCAREISPEERRTLSIECAGYDSMTKSDLDNEDDAEYLEEVNVFVYDRNGDLVNRPSGGTLKTYFTDSKDIDVNCLFPDLRESYSVYVLGGCGYLKAEDMLREESAEDFTLSFDEYWQLSEYGFPKAAVVKNLCPLSSPLRIWVKRLFARYDIKIVNDSGRDFRLKEVKVRQCAMDIHPLQECSKAENVFDDDGDYFSDEELAAFSGTLYVPENIRGEVFESCNSSSDRTMENLDDDQKGKCTFLEICGKLTDTDGGVYEDATFRYFFGSGSSACVTRNRLTDLTLRLSENCVRSDSWRKTPGKYKLVLPETKELEFHWFGTYRFICPPYSEDFEGVREIFPTISYPLSTPVESTVEWTVKSSPKWIYTTRVGDAIEYAVAPLYFGDAARSGEIVLESSDGSLSAKISVSQTPPSSWMKFPSNSNCLQDCSNSGDGTLSVYFFYHSNTSANDFKVVNTFAVTASDPDTEDTAARSALEEITYEYGSSVSSGDSPLRYRHPVLITIPSSTLQKLRDSAGSDGRVLYFDFDNTVNPLYSEEHSYMESGLPRFVLRLS